MVIGSLKEEKGKSSNSFIFSCFVWFINFCFFKLFLYCKKYIVEMMFKIVCCFSIRIFYLIKLLNDLYYLKNVKDLIYFCNMDFYVNSC